MVFLVVVTVAVVFPISVTVENFLTPLIPVSLFFHINSSAGILGILEIISVSSAAACTGPPRAIRTSIG